MNPASRISIAGHRCLVGSAILRNLQARGYANFVLRTHADLVRRGGVDPRPNEHIHNSMKFLDNFAMNPYSSRTVNAATAVRFPAVSCDGDRR